MGVVIRGCDVLVLGAGMAGLATARALGERGLKVVVLEARERVGGRVLSLQADGATVELGAEFVHGRAPELWALIDEAGVETVERDGSMLRAEYGGEVLEDDPQDGAMFAPLEALEEYAGEDMAFADWLAQSDLPEDGRAALTGYVEGFNAADARRIGVYALGAQQKAEDATEGDRSWHVRGGYAQLAEYVTVRVRELGGEVMLGAVVRRVEWQAGHVRVTVDGGSVFESARCVVTLPLGVLQRGSVKFVPEPVALVAARRLEMGHVVRFTMVFRSRWWEGAQVGVSEEALREMSFLFTTFDMPSVWWTMQPENGHPENGSPKGGPATLTGWVGGPRSAALAGQTAAQLGDEACRTLAGVFRMREEDVRAELVSTHAHDWSGDPFALGAYSYVPVGALDAPRAMTVPEEGTMFFAGEHTDVTGHWGTVHAAIRSGLRAADQVLGEGWGCDLRYTSLHHP